jgi:hypothetical protein
VPGSAVIGLDHRFSVPGKATASPRTASGG